MTSFKFHRRTALPTPVIWKKKCQRQIYIVNFFTFLHNLSPKIQVYQKKFWNIFFFWLENSDFQAKVENVKNPNFGHVSRLIKKTNEFFTKNCLFYMKEEPFGNKILKKSKLYHFFSRRYLRSLTPTISPDFQSGSAEIGGNRSKSSRVVTLKAIIFLLMWGPRKEYKENFTQIESLISRRNDETQFSAITST